MKSQSSSFTRGVPQGYMLGTLCNFEQQPNGLLIKISVRRQVFSRNG